MLAQSKLNSIEVLISRALVDLYISHNEFASVNSVSRKYDDMKEVIKNLKTNDVNRSTKIYLSNVFIQHIFLKTKLLCCLKCRKNTESKDSKVTRTNNGKLTLFLKCTECDSKN